jgi:osmotically-inducible protein OsmY
VSVRARSRAARPRRRLPKAAARAARRRPPAPKLSGRRNVLVLGQSDLSKRITRAIRRLGIPCRRMDTPDAARSAMNEMTKALVVIPPIPSLSVSAFARGLDSELVSIPIFVVMEGPLPTRTVRKLYNDGVEAVFEWPGDRQPFKRTLFRVSTPAVTEWSRAKTPAEIALEETTRAHLNAEAVPFGAHLGVEACRRFVILKGSLDALWKLELARQIIADIPGVEDVVADGVEITGQARDDRATARAIREVLRHAALVEGSTLAVSVRSGEVTLTGSVRDRREASRALELIEQVRGVRRVCDYLVISARGKKQDKALASRVREVLRTRYPRLSLDVAVFGSVAVISGSVPRAGVRDKIKQLVHGQEGVDRVVDKLSVSGRAPR